MAATAAVAFSSDLRVISSRGNGPPSSTSSVARRPALRASARRCEYAAGIIAEPGIARPSVSATIAIVLAVNWPGHEPSVGAQSWPS